MNFDGMPLTRGKIWSCQTQLAVPEWGLKPDPSVTLRCKCIHGIFHVSGPNIATLPIGMTLVLPVTLSFCHKQLSICPAKWHLPGVNASE